MKTYIENLKNLDEKSVLETLKSATLSSFEKNFIYTYLFPKPLKHMELLEVVGNKRTQHNQTDLLKPDSLEVLILLRAYRTEQYRKFILHLLHSFIENQGGTYIVNEEVEEHDTCSICGKKLYPFSMWSKMLADYPESPENNRKEYLMFGNDQTGLCMCLDCMIQLKELNTYLENIEGSDYLIKRKIWGTN